MAIAPQSTASSSAIGQLLLQRGLVSQQDLDKGLAFQKQFKGRLGSILVRMGALSEDSLLPVLAEQVGLTLLAEADLPERPEPVAAAVQASGLSPDWFHDQELVAWESADGTIHCASRNPISSYLQETLGASLAGRAHEWHFLRTRDLERMLKLVEARGGDTAGDEVSQLRELAEQAPTIELVSNIMAQAIDEDASDIHIEPEERSFDVRYRVDGVLHTRMTQPRARFDAVSTRIKLVAGMDIAERRLPQDGRISIRAAGRDMDVRVSALPGVHGESLVLRLLPKERSNLDLKWLGMEPDHLTQFSRWVMEPHGIILVTGPTGSGKSTTLYAALSAADDKTKKMITVEDPVEFRLPGVTQVQAHGDIGYDFARALRAILRQDPDVIMIGEIRDLETAQIAVQASLTGHLVLSTLHTNDALSSFTRLLDMGVEPFLVASSVRAVQAQRLVRRLCAACSRPEKPADSILDLLEERLRSSPALFATAENWRVPVGCGQCRHSGYRGRIGIYEMLEVDEALQEGVMRRATAGELAAIARNAGFRNLREDGLVKARRGLTSVDEVLRVTGSGIAVE